MPIPATLPMSEFNGEVFVSTSHAVRRLFEQPSVTLATFHPFRQLWQHHLQSLTQPGSLFEGVIDSLAAILLGDPLWKDTSTPTDLSRTRSDVRSLLLKSPPNIIILKNYRHYGCHERCSSLWNYICISKGYVKLWADADVETQRQGLAALRNRSRTRSLGANHPDFPLGSQKSGYCYLSPVHCKLTTDDLFTDDLSTDVATDFATDHDPFASNISGDDDSLSDAGTEEVSSSGEASPSGLSSGSADGTKVPSSDCTEVSSPSDDTSGASPSEHTDDTSKVCQAPWAVEAGEAGNFVELSTRGGIMEYDAVVKQPYLVVGPRESDIHFLSNSYLELYHQNDVPSNSLIFHPASRSTKPSRSGLSLKGLAFPFGGVDRCLSTQTPDSLYQRNYHGYVPTKVHKL